MKVLVTGASGFVGRHLLPALERSYPHAALIGTSGPSDPPRTSVDGYDAIPLDLASHRSIQDVVNAVQPTHVIHLAGFASGAGTDAAGITNINASGTEALLSALATLPHPVTAVLASSGYVYGTTPAAPGADEAFPCYPSGAYAASKAAMEDAAAKLVSEKLSIVVSRSFNHTGPLQTTQFVVPAFAQQLARIERGELPPVVKVGNLDALRDFLPVADVVDAYSKMLMLDAPFTVMNVASGVGVSVRELLDRLIEIAGIDVTVELDPTRLRASDVPCSIGNPAKAQQVLGWVPSCDLSSMLASTLAYWRGQNVGLEG
ncbi:MAG: GDP-mannose 4,6-dehydratase [Armatimonadota bacterium]